MGKLKLNQEMEDGKSKDKSNMIQELWNTQMTVPELCFEADRTNNTVKRLLVAIILFYFFSLSLFFLSVLFDLFSFR